MNYQSPKRDSSSAVDALLASYAAGAVSPALRALVSAHLWLSDENRNFVTALEHVAAREMESVPGVPVRARSERLDAIFATALDGAVGSAAARVEDGLLPQPLHRFMGRGIDELSWTTKLPGIREAVIDDAEGSEAVLYWIRAGRAIPAHTHEGLEATLVLQGSFSDQTGVYRRGDICVVDGETDHKPVAGTGEDCVCYAVTEGAIRLTGPVARLFNRLRGH